MHNTKYKHLTTTEIKPNDWMLAQLKIQAEGLSGNLDKIWPDIKDSKWIGGDKDGWERVPYWLDGFIPLAYLLRNDDMIERSKKYIDAIIERQCIDGWICPCAYEERAKYDVWSAILISKVLVVYYECSNDDRIESVVEKLLKNLNEHLDTYTLMDWWGQTRWYECLISVQWLYQKKPMQWLLDLTHKMEKQSLPFDEMCEKWKHKRYTTGFPYSHVVNCAMAVKGPAIYSLFSDKYDASYSKEMIKILDEYHSMPTGHFTGDEHLAGNGPLAGSECCSVVEYMFSLEKLFEITGDAYYLDKLERVAFNALPATLSQDMWTHQYDQITNQVQCVRFEKGKQTFSTNPEDSHLFGLEPNFGCCTSNFNQGFPKLALSSYMKKENELIATVLIPSEVSLKLSAGEVKCKTITNYPFEDKVVFEIDGTKAEQFTFSFYVPLSAKQVFVNGEEVQSKEIYSITKKWGAEKIIVDFVFDITLEKRPSDMYVVKRGALLFSIAIDEQWNMQEYEKDGVVRKFPYCDYEIVPKSRWNYAFTSDDFELINNKREKYFFDNKKPMLYLKGRGIPIKWDMINGICAEIPAQPIEIIGNEEEIILIPYGCTNLRMTELPYLYSE